MLQALTALLREMCDANKKLVSTMFQHQLPYNAQQQERQTSMYGNNCIAAAVAAGDTKLCAGQEHLLPAAFISPAGCPSGRSDVGTGSTSA